MSNTVVFGVVDAELKKKLEAQGFEVYLNSEYVARTNKPITDWDFADMQDTVLVSLEKQTPQGLLRVELSSQGDRHLEMFAAIGPIGLIQALMKEHQDRLTPASARAVVKRSDFRGLESFEGWKPGRYKAESVGFDEAEGTGVLQGYFFQEERS